MATIVLLVASTQARDLFVDQRHPQAADSNPGTETQPYKTIQPAVNAAGPGDTIWIKQGVYAQPINITRSGTIDAPIVMSAWRDDRVRIGSVLSDLAPADLWKPVAN
jgi:pectin methylesterase-like acyl-CoA thioesterase